MAAAGNDLPDFLPLAAHPLRWHLLRELADSDYRVRELTERLGEPQNLVSYHLRQLRDGGLVIASRSTHDARDSYYHLDLDRCAAALAQTGSALHPALRAEPTQTPPRRRRSPSARVLFVCTGNSARSPLAEAFLRRDGDGRFEVASAGSKPKPELHPHAVRVLRDEYGIDVRQQRPKHWDVLPRGSFDHVISLCDKAREAWPDSGDRARRVHWSVADPATADYRAFRRTAQEIETRVRHLLPVLAPQI